MKSAAFSVKATDTQEPQVRKLVKRRVTGHACLHACTPVRPLTHTHTHMKTHTQNRKCNGASSVEHPYGAVKPEYQYISVYLSLKLRSLQRQEGGKEKEKKKCLKHYDIALVYILRFIYYIYY